MEIEDVIDNGDDGNDDDDDEGWITPVNIKKVKKDMGCNNQVPLDETNVQCACLTTDFAMQVRYRQKLY